MGTIPPQPYEESDVVEKLQPYVIAGGLAKQLKLVTVALRLTLGAPNLPNHSCDGLIKVLTPQAHFSNVENSICFLNVLIQGGH